jgi:hypothetical protein
LLIRADGGQRVPAIDLAHHDLAGREQSPEQHPGASIDSKDTLNFSALAKIRPMIEAMPLEQATAAYDRMMSGDARFRIGADYRTVGVNHIVASVHDVKIISPASSRARSQPISLLRLCSPVDRDRAEGGVVADATIVRAAALGIDY